MTWAAARMAGVGRQQAMPDLPWRSPTSPARFWLHGASPWLRALDWASAVSRSSAKTLASATSQSKLADFTSVLEPMAMDTYLLKNFRHTMVLRSCDKNAVDPFWQPVSMKGRCLGSCRAAKGKTIQKRIHSKPYVKLTTMQSLGLPCRLKCVLRAD